MYTINALCLERADRDYGVARLLRVEQTDSSDFCFATQLAISPTDNRVFVDSFVVDGQQLRLYPPLSFVLLLDPDTLALEVRGVNVYEDILIYGDTLDRALETLQLEVLPILWEDCMEEDDTVLSPRARRMAVDFRTRVIG